jgi:gluconate 2-dehydrogenase gamma chain
MRRREFITIPVRASAAAALYGIGAGSLPVNAQSVRMRLRFFTEAEARTVQAACERILPGDESGPGAMDAGVVIYIDRQLAGPWGRDAWRYTKAPWFESVPEHGYQGRDNPRQIYRKGIASLGDFAGLDAHEQDERLMAIEHTLFFQMLRTQTIEGMFCDPLHGGNAGLVGWKLIGFPGPVMSYREQIDGYYGRAYRPKPVSLEQVVGHPVKGLEDEGS